MRLRIFGVIRSDETLSMTPKNTPIYMQRHPLTSERTNSLTHKHTLLQVNIPIFNYAREVAHPSIHPFACKHTQLHAGTPIHTPIYK
jgi:hypothetical protein